MSALTVKDVKKKMKQEAERRRNYKPPLPLIEDALERHRGNLTEAANELDMNYMTLRKMAECHPTLMNILVSQREGLIDLAEDKLRDNLMTGDMKAVIFTLKTLGRRRGYEERSEIPPMAPDNTVRAKLDPRKLSTDQLMQLKAMMDTAAPDEPADDIIDVTPEPVNQ